MALINCTLAPFINEQFVVTGAWGEERGDHRHAGIDLATIKAVPSQPSRVYSMSDGVVTFVDPDGHTGSGYGPYVIVWNTSNNDLWLYGDLSENPSVVLNQTITQGQLIGFEGNPSGTASTGLHVHLEKENQSDGVFKYYYQNSIDPTTGTGILNEVYSTSGEIYIYNEEPTPVGTIKKNKFKWVFYAKKIRARNNKINML